MFRYYFLLSFFFFFLLGCDQKPDTCKEQSARQLKFGFYVSVKGSKDSVLRNFKAVLPANNFTKNINNVRNFTVPLFQSADSSVYNLTINGKKNSTVVVYYSRDRIFENYKCGFRTDFHLVRIVANPQFCDSIIISQPYITDVIQENCRLYFSRDTLKYQ